MTQKIPIELIGLWNFQYAPRERLIRNALHHPEDLERWDNLKYTKKMQIIDNMQKKGQFGR